MNSPQSSRPYICEKCGSSFKKKWNLKVHMESHSEPFECNVCHLKFKFKHKLRSHMGRHTGVIKYNCKRCPAVFGYKKMLNTHMDIHLQSPSNYRYCHGCGAHFSKTDDLEAHFVFCPGIKKCEDDDDDDDDCKSISFHGSEELAQNIKKNITEEPLLFEDERRKQLLEKNKAIAEQDRSNNGEDKDEGNTCRNDLKSRQGHGSKHEGHSDMIVSIVIEDIEEIGSRSEGSIENGNNRDSVNNGNCTPGNFISKECQRISHGNLENIVRNSSDDSVIRAEHYVASEAVRETDNIHQYKDKRSSVTEVPLHSADVGVQCHTSFDSEVVDSSTCNQSKYKPESKSAVGLKSAMVRMPVIIVKQLSAINASVPKTKSHELDERNEVVNHDYPFDKESDSNIGHDDTSKNILVESQNQSEALVSEFNENERSMFEVDGDSHEVSSGGLKRKHVNESTNTTENQTACLVSACGLQTKTKTIKSSKYQRKKRKLSSSPESATEVSGKGRLLKKNSETAVNDTNNDSHVVKLNQKRKRKCVINQDQARAKRREEKKKNKRVSTTAISIDEKNVSQGKDVCVTRSITLLSKNNILDLNLSQNFELRNTNRKEGLTVHKLQALCHAIVKWDIRPCYVQIEKLPKDVVDAHEIKVSRSSFKQKIISSPSVRTNQISSISNESLRSPKKANTAVKLLRSPNQKKRQRRGKVQTNSSGSKRRPLNDTLFPVEDLESTPEIAKRTRRWTRILKRAKMCLKLRNRLVGLKEENGYQFSDDSGSTATENESSMEERENTHEVDLSPARSVDHKQATMQSPDMLLSAHLIAPDLEIKVKEEKIDITSEFLDYDF